MAERGVIFSEGQADRIGDAVLRLEYAARNRRPAPRPFSRPLSQRQFLEGILDGDLDPATDIATPTTATLSIWRPDLAGVWTDTLDDVEVTNRDPTTSFVSGDYITVLRIASEWRPSSGAIGSGTGRRRVYRVSGSPFGLPVGPDVVLMCYPIEFGAAIVITLAGGAEGQEAIIKNAETPGLFGRTVNFTFRTGTGSAVAVMLPGGAGERILYTGTVLGGGDDDWYSV